LQLPKASLAAHMRSLEMPTVSQVHQAHMLNEASEFHLNSDGTTLNQKKVQGMLVNGGVWGARGKIHRGKGGESREKQTHRSTNNKAALQVHQ